MAVALNSGVKDVIFIIIFSALIFFGAFFLFSSLAKTKVNKQISVRSLEEKMNHKVNERIQVLQAKNKIFKSQLVKTEGVGRDEVFEENFSNTKSKYELDVFQGQGSQVLEILPQNAFEKVQALLDLEDLKALEKKELLKEYKKQIIQRAFKQGWAIKLNDDLEVTSVKKR